MSWENPISGSALHAAIRRWRSPGESLYAVLDAARDRQMVYVAQSRCGLTMDSLFGPRAAPHMAEVAPYLVPVPFRESYPYPDSAFIDLWAEELGTSSGILLLSAADPDKLLVHLRRVFRVTDEEYHPYFFRFYDPRVLRVYLPTCNPADAAEFFGPIGRILVEAQDEGRMLVCHPGGSGVVIGEQPIVPAPDPVSPARGRWR